MIYCNLAGLMANKKVNISEVSRDTKLSRTTLTALYYNEFKGIQIDTADTLCRYFNVGMDRVFIFSKYDISARVTESYGNIFEDQTNTAGACVELTIQNGSAQKKCEISVDISISTNPGFPPLYRCNIGYYDPDDNLELEASNAFLVRVLKNMPDEIKPLVIDKIVDCIEDHFLLREYVDWDIDVTNDLW